MSGILRTIQIYTYGHKFDDESLSQREKNKESDKNNKVAAPKIIHIEVVASLDVVSSGDRIVPRTGSKQCAYLVRT